MPGASPINQQVSEHANMQRIASRSADSESAAIIEQLEDIKRHVDASLGSIKQRLENIEARNGDPFGDVKNALNSIETRRCQLETELSNMYQRNIDQMSQAAKALGTWHGQIKSEVSQCCEEHNAELLKADEQIFARLDTLEQADTACITGIHGLRLDSLATAAKSFANTSQLDDVVARICRIDEALCRHEQQEGVKLGQHEFQIGTLQKEIQELCSNTTNRIYGVSNACDGRYEDLQASNSKVESRLSELEGWRKTADQRERDSQVKIDAMQDKIKTAEQRERDSQAQIDAMQDRIKALEAGLAQSQQRSESHDPLSPDQSPCSRCKENDTRITDLSRRVQEHDKASHRRYDFLAEKLAGKEASMESNMTGSESNFASVMAQLNPVKGELLRLKQSQTTHVQHIAGRLSKLESARMPSSDGQAALSTELRDAIADLRERFVTIESSLGTAAIDSRFTSLAERVAEIEKKWEEHPASQDQMHALADKVIALESAQTEAKEKAIDGCSLVAKHEDLRWRLDNVEEHARTSAIHHNANASNQMDCQTRLRTLENTVNRQASDAAKERLMERVAKIEDKTSEDNFQRCMDKVSVRHIATLADITGRLSALEKESRLTDAGIRRDIEATQLRVRALEDSAIAVATDERFKSFSEILQLLREQIAAQDTNQLASRTARLEEEVQEINVARGVRGQVVTDLLQRADNTSSLLAQKQSAVDELALETKTVSVRQGDLKEQFTDLKDVLDETRAWIERVSEKSRHDDQTILSKVQLCNREHDLRLGFAEDEMERLRDGMQMIRDHPARQQGEGCLADDIRRLRQRLGDAGLDHAAQGQLTILIRAVMNGITSSPPQQSSDQHDEEDIRQTDLLASASAFLQQHEVSGNHEGTVDDEGRADARHEGEEPDVRKRKREWESGRDRSKDGPRTPGEDGMRRSERAGKGKNRRLEADFRSSV